MHRRPNQAIAVFPDQDPADVRAGPALGRGGEAGHGRPFLSRHRLHVTWAHAYAPDVDAVKGRPHMGPVATGPTPKFDHLCTA
jgi:hypothetical protein